MHNNHRENTRDVVYLEESHIFSLFLRGVYSWKALLLFSRNTVQSLFRLQMSVARKASGQKVVELSPVCKGRIPINQSLNC